MSRREGLLVAVDGISGSAVAAAAQALKADGHRSAGVSQWDASGIFGELASAEEEAPTPSVRVLLLLYAADLAFRLRWEIRPALAQGRVVIAAPYVDTAVAFGRAAGLPAGWLKDVFGFAPSAPESRRVPTPHRTAASIVAHGQGFIEFACRRISGTRSGLSRDQLIARAREYLQRQS
jgi:thymidylate kinase